VRLGYRQRFLLLTGAGYAAVGAVVWYDTRRGYIAQLPIDSLFHTSGYAVGYIWFAGAAVILALCWWPPADRWLYALAAAAAAAWAGSWVVHAIRFRSPGDWGSAAGWVIFGLALLLVAGWPEPS
jgi:hypothetical protein